MSILHIQLPRLKFKHVLQGFTDEIEEIYYDDFYRISLPIVRVALVLGICLYSLFGILDIWIVPIHKNAVWIIRYAIVCPALAAVLVMTYFDIFKKYMQSVLSVVGFMAGIGIVFMIGISVESEPGFKFYYAGLMLVIIWIYSLVRLRFIYATAVSLLITVGYEINAVFVNGLLATPDNRMVFINNNFFFIGANILGMFACFTIEWYMRKNFLLREEINKANNLNSKYLHNIREGLLLINNEYIIMNQYSSFLTSMFEMDEFQGISFIDLIYPDSSGQEEDRRDLERFLKFLFHNRSADMEMIMDLNPFKQKKINISKNELVSKEIIVNADFIRVQDKESVELIMVIFEDITGILNYEKQIQEQKTRYQQEVESVTAILKSGPALFSNFIEESGLILNEISSKKSRLGESATLNHVFRLAHSLKGSAKHLELNHISGLSHKIEDMLSTLRDNPGKSGAAEMQQIDELIVELFREFRELSKMIERLKEFSNVNTGIKDTVHQTALDEFLGSLVPMAASISGELGKDVRLEIDNRLEDIPFIAQIKNPLIHMIRNSIDHGIEDQFERLSRNKSAAGKITVRLSDDGTSYNIEVADDGGGIDFDRIRMKAIDKNLAGDNPSELTKSKLLRMIFTPGFSSRDTVTELSGRGYGLDIVKDAADQLNGKVIVDSRKGRGTSIRITIPHEV